MDVYSWSILLTHHHRNQTLTNHHRHTGTTNRGKGREDRSWRNCGVTGPKKPSHRLIAKDRKCNRGTGPKNRSHRQVAKDQKCNCGTGPKNLSPRQIATDRSQCYRGTGPKTKNLSRCQLAIRRRHTDSLHWTTGLQNRLGRTQGMVHQGKGRDSQVQASERRGRDLTGLGTGSCISWEMFLCMGDLWVEFQS